MVEVNNPELLTPEQAAALLGLSVKTLATWRSTGRHAFAFIRCGARIRYRRSDLEAWLGQRQQTSTGPREVCDGAGEARTCPWVAVADRLPVSGRTVLAFYINSVGRVRRIRAQYIERWTVEVDAATADPDTECVEYSESADAFYLLEGWYECIDNWDDYTRIAVTEGQVSHWMPLPAAPVDSVGEVQHG